MKIYSTMSPFSFIINWQKASLKSKSKNSLIHFNCLRRAMSFLISHSKINARKNKQSLWRKLTPNESQKIIFGFGINHSLNYPLLQCSEFFLKPENIDGVFVPCIKGFSTTCVSPSFSFVTSNHVKVNVLNRF